MPNLSAPLTALRRGRFCALARDLRAASGDPRATWLIHHVVDTAQQAMATEGAWSRHPVIVVQITDVRPPAGHAASHAAELPAWTIEVGDRMLLLGAPTAYARCCFFVSAVIRNSEPEARARARHAFEDAAGVALLVRVIGIGDAELGPAKWLRYDDGQLIRD
jgi:hypothetical protein